jgi:Family of unknown function (DUF5519)
VFATTSEAARREAWIVHEVTRWPGVATRSGEFGETDFAVGGRSIGHVHGGRQADIPYPRRIRDELVSAGRTAPHHVHPDSGWTTLYIRDDHDAATVVELLRLNYDRITDRHRV